MGNGKKLFDENGSIKYNSNLSFKCLELVLLSSYLHVGPNTRHVITKPINIKYKFLLFGFPLFPAESFAEEI